MPTILEMERQSKVDTQPLSPQSAGRRAVASRVYDLFCRYRLLRDRPQELFRDRTLKEYIDDNIKRFIQFKRRPAHKKNWQSNLASTTPNEKLIGILSKLAMKGMEARTVSQKEVSPVEMMREKVSNYFLKGAAIKNDDDFQIILEMLEAGEKGTVIGFEDWYHGKRTIREILDQDPETGDLKFKEITIKEWNDVRSSLVNLNDFYPETTYVRPGKVQDMDACFLRTLMYEDEFLSEFGKYQDAELVQICSKAMVNESTPFWRQSIDVQQDQIEVLRYFNKKTDEYVILANEIWINPVKGTAVVQPLPWNHKKLPFWGGVFEPLDANFFYGRSIIDKLIADCDAKDGLFDRIMDQVTMSVSRPIVTDGKAASAMTKGFLQPNNVITTDWTDGRPNFEVVPIPEPPNSAVTMYQLLQQRQEQSTLSSQIIGGESPRDKTATEVSIEREAANQIVSLFSKLMESAIKDKTRLRYPNMLQFYSLPSNKGTGGDRFKKVILRNEKLTTGKVGTIQVEITPKPSQERVLQNRSMMTEPTEFIEITPSFLRDFEPDIEIIEGSSVKMTPEQRQKMEYNWQNVVNSLYGDMVNREKGFEMLAQVYGKDPQEVKSQQPPQQPGAMPGMPAAPGQPMPQPMNTEAKLPALV